MAEKSMLWSAPTSGDGSSSYTEDETTRLFRAVFGALGKGGVILGYDNELAVSGTSSPVSVNTGAAFVYGYFYWNTASVSVTVPTPVLGTTLHKIILRADWSAKTVRIARIAGSDGSPVPPSVTQNPGVIYEIPLAEISITTGGVITVTDSRSFAHFGSKVNANMFEMGVIEDVHLNKRILRAPYRQGGDASNWHTIGTSNYQLESQNAQMFGSVRWTGAAAASGSVAITFPPNVTFVNTPIVFVTPYRTASAPLSVAVNPTTTGFTLYWQDGTAATYTSIDFFWMVIGNYSGYSVT